MVYIPSRAPQSDGRLSFLACRSCVIMCNPGVHRPPLDNVKPLHPDLVGNGVQRVAVQQVNRAGFLALAGPPVAAGPVRLGILVDDCLNFAWEFHFVLCCIILNYLATFNFNNSL